MRIAIFVLGLVTVLGGSAHAQWMSKVDDDPFSNEKNAIAMSITAEGYAFGFSCKGKDEYQLVYLTVEKSKDDPSSMNFLSPILKVKVDGMMVVDLPALIDQAGDKIRLSASGPKALEVTKQIANAKQRVALAVELGGQRFHVQTFGINGSKDSILKSLKACKLDSMG